MSVMVKITWDGLKIFLTAFLFFIFKASCAEGYKSTLSLRINTKQVGHVHQRLLMRWRYLSSCDQMRLRMPSLVSAFTVRLHKRLEMDNEPEQKSHPAQLVGSACALE